MSNALFTPQATGLSPSRLVRWDALDVLVAVGVAAAAYSAARWLPHPVGLSKAAGLLASSTILNAAFAGAPLLLLALRHRRPILGTLVPGGRRALDFGWGLELALLVGIINALSVQRLVLAGSLAEHPGYYERAFNVTGPADLAFMLLGWGILSPIAEEIFFRGFIFTALRRHMRAPLAVVLSALAFSLLHAPYLEPMAATLILGIVAATVYEYSGSLLPPIMAHLGMNVFFVLFMADHGETAKRVPPWLLIAGAAVFAIHFFVSSRYLFRKPRQN